jgi:hypothetical protein
MKLKRLELLAEGEPTKQMKRFERKLKELFKSELKMNGKLMMTVLSPFSASYEFKYERVLDDRSFEAMIKDIQSVLRQADEEGHVHKIDDHSSNPAEVLLNSLRPGMKVDADAFFPTISFTVTWKQLMKTR